MNSKEIVKRWQDVGIYARNKGTWLHFNIERYFNGLVSVAAQIFRIWNTYIDIMYADSLQLSLEGDGSTSSLRGDCADKGRHHPIPHRVVHWSS